MDKLYPLICKIFRHNTHKFWPTALEHLVLIKENSENPFTTVTKLLHPMMVEIVVLPCIATTPWSRVDRTDYVDVTMKVECSHLANS